MSLYAVIDTNVLVGALLSRHDDSAVVQVLNLVADKIIIPLYSKDIINEYKEVLFRAKLAIDSIIIFILFSYVDIFYFNFLYSF